MPQTHQLVGVALVHWVGPSNRAGADPLAPSAFYGIRSLVEIGGFSVTVITAPLPFLRPLTGQMGAQTEAEAQAYSERYSGGLR